MDGGSEFPEGLVTGEDLILHEVTFLDGKKKHTEGW